MRIAVITPTRGRPANAITLSNVLERTTSGEHQITHFLSCDTDDESRRQFLRPLIPRFVQLVEMPRADSLGEAWNAPLTNIGPNWDICTFIGDDVMPLTPGWDKGIAWLVGKHEVAAWCEDTDPNSPTYPIMTRRFVEAMDGKPYTDWFPFWFDDPWLNEVVTFATGRGIPIVTDLRLYAKSHGITQGMRDLAFWVEFFIAMRPRRIKQGHALAGRMGWTEPDPASPLELFTTLDGMWPGRIPLIEKACNANQGEPSERYLRAKARAQAWMTTAH